MSCFRFMCEVQLWRIIVFFGFILWKKQKLDVFLSVLQLLLAVFLGGGEGTMRRWLSSHACESKLAQGLGLAVATCSNILNLKLRRKNNNFNIHGYFFLNMFYVIASAVPVYNQEYIVSAALWSKKFQDVRRILTTTFQKLSFQTIQCFILLHAKPDATKKPGLHFGLTAEYRALCILLDENRDFCIQQEILH